MKLSKADEAFLDENMIKYLDRRSYTGLDQIHAQFELHTTRELAASLARLTELGRVAYDGHRRGYMTCRPGIVRMQPAQHDH